MGQLQTLVNGIVLGTLYACLAVGFSLVWGVLNIVNMLHGSLVIILSGYITYFAWHDCGIHPLLALRCHRPASDAHALPGYVTQLLVINKVVHQPVLVTMTLTFGLDLILYNFMTVYYTATPRRVTLDLGATMHRRHRDPVRPHARHGAGAGADPGLLYGDAALARRPRHRRGAHGQRRGGA